MNLRVELSPEVVEEIVERVAALVLERLGGPHGASPWLYGARAASAYLGLPLGAIQKATAAGAIPCHRLGRRVAYRRDELDGWLSERQGGPA